MSISARPLGRHPGGIPARAQWRDFSALPSLNLAPYGRLLLVAAIIDGLGTSGVFSVPIGDGQLMGYRVLLPCSLLVAAAHALTTPRGFGVYAVRVRAYLAFMAAWVGFAVVSLLWVESRSAALRQILFLLEGSCFIALSVLWLNTDRKVERVVRLWIAILATAAVVGVWEAATSHHLPGSGVMLADQRVAEEFADMPTAWFHNPNNFAFFLVLSLPLALAWTRHQVGIWKAGAILLVVVFALVALIFARARLGYIAAGIVCAVWAALPWRGRRVQIIRIRPKPVILFLLVLMPLLFTRAGSMLVNQLSSLEESLTIELATDPRVQLQQEVLDVLRNTHGFGVGAGNIEVHLERYPFSYEAALTNPHGWWVEIAGNYGVLGLVAYTIFYLALLRATWRAYKRQVRRGGPPRLLEAALVGLIAFPVVSFGPSSIAGLPTHWIFFAFCIAVLNNHRTALDAAQQRAHRL